MVVAITTLVLIGIVAGYLVAKKQSANTQQTSTTDTSPSQKISEGKMTSIIPQGWTKYDNEDLKIEFGYPSGWSTDVTKTNSEYRGDYTKIKVKNIESLSEFVKSVVRCLS